MSDARLRVLIVRIGAMGDVLHAMPAVAGLRDGFGAGLPECFIGWAIEPRWEPMLRASDGEMPLVDRVHRVATKEWKGRVFSSRTAGEIARVRQEMRAERYDVCVDLQGSIKSAVVGWLSGARRFVGLQKSREGLAGLLYGERVRVGSVNVIGQACELVAAAVGQQVSARRVEVPVDEEAERWCDEVLARSNAAVRGRTDDFVLIAPTAGWAAKEWGAANFAELAGGLMAAGYRVLINAVPGATSVVAERSGTELVGSTVAQMIALTRRAGLVVGGDTGPVHLAAALGRPVVALYGPTDPARNGPAFPGARVRVLRDAASVTDHRRHTETEAGLARIRVEEVLAACLEMLAG